MSLGSASPLPDAKKDRAIGIEYSHLQKNAPAGVFVMPSLESLRVWHGVIFVRKGVYQNGVFKFRVDLPPEYPELDAWPRVTFVVARVFNPLVDEESGALDVRAGFAGEVRWDPQRHYIVHVLTFLKKIFYEKEFGRYGSIANREALALHARADKGEYMRRVEACVRASAEGVYEAEPGSTMRFSKPRKSHAQLRASMIGPRRADADDAEEGDDAAGLATPECSVLEAIDAARRAAPR